MMVDNYYKINTMLEKKLLEEVKRFNAINKYSKKMITEQDAPPPAPTDAPIDAPTDVPTDVPTPFLFCNNKYSNTNI